MYIYSPLLGLFLDEKRSVLLLMMLLLMVVLHAATHYL